jgi:steroid delta-isomerase-like uncharacterized protein
MPTQKIGHSPDSQRGSLLWAGEFSNGRGRGLRAEAKKVLERAIEFWNATDRDGWSALYTDDVVYEAPGGARISGLADLKEQYFDALVTAAPDRGSRNVVLFADGDHVVEQARYTGTHTGTWRSPDGVEIPATGKTLDFPFVGIFRVADKKISSIRLYYDQIEVLTQLGLMPGGTPS